MSDSRAISSPSFPGARELPLRDVRDLALAVIEGAVAAESLAKELKKTPDRSRHFQEIAERLRSVVGRASIRSALTDEPPAHGNSAPPPAPLKLATPPQLRTAEVPTAEVIEQDSGAHQIVIEQLNTQQLDRMEQILRDLATDDRIAELAARVARLEEGIARALSRREEGERYALRTPEEAIALAARLTERLRRDPRVVVRIEP